MDTAPQATIRPRFVDLPDIITVREIKEFLDIGKGEAYRLAQTQLGAVRVGRRLIISKAALGAFLKLPNTPSAGTP